jgi:ubiquinone/menaquinone biosynthesis C-methylase UbiE
MSKGMLHAAGGASQDARLLVADATSLPLVDTSADLVLAMHMLYHVPDPQAAVGEFRRVLRAGGRLVVVLNAEDHLVQLGQALRDAFDELGMPAGGFGERLRLEEGEVMLRRFFGVVERHDFVSELVLDDLEPVRSYISSMVTSEAVPPARLEAYVLGALQRLTRGADGTVRITTHPGCLVCR